MSHRLPFRASAPRPGGWTNILDAEGDLVMSVSINHNTPSRVPLEGLLKALNEWAARVNPPRAAKRRK